MVTLMKSPTMEWDNATILEFIQLLQEEPIIWDCKKKTMVSRPAMAEAWQRLRRKFSTKCSVEELKKKRASLMAAYRAYVRKLNESRAASGAGESYRPSWFAFEAMHSFLGPLYEHNNFSNNGDLTPEREISEEEIVFCDTSDLLIEKKYEVDLESVASETPSTRSAERLAERSAVRLAERSAERLAERSAGRLAERSTERRVARPARSPEPDEHDLFAQMLAKKLRKMSPRDQLTLTNDIQNLVFKYEMKALPDDNVDSKGFL